MRKSEALNTFLNGMVMDINPLVSPKDLLSSALNATIITKNGNENVLLNDMGNGRVETAFLPEGFVPLGTAELGGIIYVVSYNPLTDKCQIGSFPSPERNIESSEILLSLVVVTNEMFLEEDGKLSNTLVKLKLLSGENEDFKKLNPGDKFSVYSTNKGITANKNYISDVGNTTHIIDSDPRLVTIHIVSIGEDGKILYLDDYLKWSDDLGTPANYYIKECDKFEDIQTDLDNYRSLVSSAYNIFNSKVSGELALLFELKVIDSFSVTWDAEVRDAQTISNVDYIILNNTLKIDAINNLSNGEYYLKFPDNAQNNLQELTYKINKSANISAVRLKAIEALSYTGVGYPKIDSYERIRLKNIVEDPESTDSDILDNLLHYYLSTDLELPIAGKKYTIVYCTKNKGEFYANESETRVDLLKKTPEIELTPSLQYEAIDNGDGTFSFKANSGKFWCIATQYNYNSNWLENYTKEGLRDENNEYCKVNLFKIVPTINVQESPENLFGKVVLQGYKGWDNTKHINALAVACIDENVLQYSANSTLIQNGTIASAIKITEVLENFVRVIPDPNIKVEYPSFPKVSIQFNNPTIFLNIDNISIDTNYDKEADIKFYVNYTSKHPKINAKYVILSDSIPSDLLLTTVLKGDYYTLNTQDRQNNGLDEDIKIDIGTFKYNSKQDLNTYTWDYRITPAMIFGYLDFMSLSGHINFQDIGSGKLELSEWKYYILDNDFYLKWGADIYPEINKKVDEVNFIFIPFWEIQGAEIKETTENPINSTYVTYKVPSKLSYSGNFQELITFEELNKNCLYLVDISFKYGNSSGYVYRHIYRWIYTTGLWNNEYLNRQILDFDTLKLLDLLELESETSYIDNIKTNVIKSKINIPEVVEKQDNYTAMGATITTVNYNQSDQKFEDPEIPSFTGSINLKVKNLSLLFLFVDNSVEYDAKIDSSNIKLEHANIQYEYNSDLIPTVESKIGKDFNDDLPKIILGIYTEGMNENNDTQAVDLFNCTIHNSNNNFDITIKGAMFTRINADLRNISKTVHLQLKPLLYTKDDLTSLGLKLDTSMGSLIINVENAVYFNHRDLGGGEFELHYANNNINDLDWLEFDHERNWVDSWLDVTGYSNNLNSWAKEWGGSFLLVNYSKYRQANDNIGTFKVRPNDNTPISELWELWVRTNNDRFIPINAFAKTSRELIDAISCIYVTLYKVDDTTTFLNGSLVYNKIYLHNYDEIITINCEMDITSNNFTLNISLQYENCKLTILDLLGLCSQKNIINTDNILLDTNYQTTVPFLVSHIFNLRNSLVLEYDKYTKDYIECIGYPSISNNTVITTIKNPNQVYVYGSSSGFLLASKNPSLVAVDGKVNYNNNNFKLGTDYTTAVKDKIIEALMFKNNQLCCNESYILRETFTLFMKTSINNKAEDGWDSGIGGLKVTRNSNYGFGMYEKD